jgi:hypothetical protein
MKYMYQGVECDVLFFMLHVFKARIVLTFELTMTNQNQQSTYRQQGRNLGIIWSWGCELMFCLTKRVWQK